MIAILSAMDIECEKLIGQMDNAAPFDLNGRTFTHGRLKNHDIIVGAASVGKTNAAIGAQMVIDRFHPDAIIHTGIAGGLHKDAALLRVVLGESITFHDMDPKILEKFYPYQTAFHSDEKLLAIAEKYMQDSGNPYLKGLIVTGDQFIESQEQKDQILSRHPAALAADMESAAIANAAFVNGIALLVIRTISDLADDASRETYDNNMQRAADIGAKIVMRVLDNFAQ